MPTNTVQIPAPPKALQTAVHPKIVPKPPRKSVAHERRCAILAAAIFVALRDGFQRITREAIAEKSGMSAALVSHYMGTMENLRRDVMREALRTKELKVLGEGLLLKHKVALQAPAALRIAAIASLSAK